MKIGEEEAQSNNWKFGKSEGKNKNEGSLKSKAQKIEVQWETPRITQLEH